MKARRLHSHASVGLLAGSLLVAALANGCADPCEAPAGSPAVATPGPEGTPGAIALGDPLRFRARSEGLEVSEVQTAGDFVLFCNGIGGLFIQETSNPDALVPTDKLLSSLSHPRFPRCQHVAATLLGDDLRHVAWTNKGDELQETSFVSVFEMTAGAREVALFTEDDASVPASFEGVAMRDNWIFVAAHGAGLFVIELQSQTPVERARLEGFDNAFGVELVGDTLYVADGTGGLKVVDVSTPSAPTITGSLALPGASLQVEVPANGTVAYVSAGSAGVHVVDVSGAPRLASTLDTPGSAVQVALTEDRLFVADWNDVRIFDTTAPLAPVAIGSERPEVNAPFPRILGIGARGSEVFVGEWSGLFTYTSQLGFGAPDLQVSARDIVFERVETGDVGATALPITNGGLFPLVINQLSSAGPFSISEDSLEVAPGETGFLEVLFSPLTEGLQRSSIQICSNDIDEPKREINVFGNPSGLVLGNEAPETRLELLDGGQLDIADLEGNVVLLAYFATF